MADEQPVQNVPLDDDKRDTVRINLPQGISGKPPTNPTPTVRLRPAGTPTVAQPSADAKKATAAITPGAAAAATPAQKKDTSRVQATAAKPSVPEMPRPTVKLKREEHTAATPVAAAPQPAPAPIVAAPATSSVIDVVLAIAAMVMALAVAGYLFSLYQH